MPLPRRLLPAWPVCLLLLATAPAGAQAPQNVLVLTSEETETPAVGLVIDEAVNAMRAAHGALNVYVESLHRSTFAVDADSLVALYRQRYGTRRLDLVMAVCGPALDFALRHRQDLFPGTPILYSFVDASMIAATPAAANISGVLLDPDWTGLVHQALKLHPRTRRLLVVTGASDFDRGWRASFDAIAPALDSRVTRQYAANRTVRDLLGDVATADDFTLVLALTFTRDAEGTPYNARHVVELVRRVSAVPIYGPSITYLGAGAVGGSLLDFGAHGRQLGALGLRVLSGERPDRISPVTTPRRLEFDWRELQRFGIRVQQLPAGAEILFQEPGIWAFHPRYILAVVALLAGQTALIVAMFAQRRKRASLEKSLTTRLRFETLLSDTSAALGGVTTARLEAALATAVATMRQYLGVDRLSVFEFTPDGSARRTFEDAAAGMPVAPAAYPLSRLPLMALTLASLQPFVMEKVEDLPADAEREREAIRTLGIRSIVIVPLEVGGQALGALSCVSHVREMRWPADRVHQVRTLGQALANALQRRITDLAVVESDRLRGAVLSSMPAQIAVLDRAGVIIAVNDAWLACGRANGIRHEASISPGASYLAVCERGASAGAPGAAEALDGVKAVCEGVRDVYDAAYSLEGRNGERWFAMKVVPLRHAAGGAVVTHRDVTADKRQELALRESEQRFRLLADAQRVLSGRLISAQEDERRRIARELHDDLQQRLALLAIELDAIATARQSLTSDAAVACARRLWQATVEISSDVHALSYRLHPSKLEALGLLKTVEGYCRELSQHGLRISFRHDRVPDCIPPDVALCVFRVVQESLQNVVKHSAAADARVTMTGGQGSLRVTIEDDGRGFDTTAGRESTGLGLVSMRERLHVVGGELTIESAPGQGTRVAFKVPCPDEESAPPDAARDEARMT